MVHELAHQWFGDSVSVHHWRDVWMNEGFATFMEQLWNQDHGGPSTRTWLHQVYGSTPAQASFWQLAVAGPGPAHLFDWPVYQRGAMALAALRERIGHPVFAHLLPCLDRPALPRARHDGRLPGARVEAQRPGPHVVLRRLGQAGHQAAGHGRQRPVRLSRATG